MIYLFSDTDSSEMEKEDIGFISEIIKMPYEHWLEGTGDSSIQIIPGERLILIKLKEGICLMQHPDYLAPLVKENTNKSNLLHYIGGEPMEIPIACLCDEKKAYDVIQFYIESKGKLLPSFKWVNIFD